MKPHPTRPAGHVPAARHAGSTLRRDCGDQGSRRSAGTDRRTGLAGDHSRAGRADRLRVRPAACWAPPSRTPWPRWASAGAERLTTGGLAFGAAYLLAHGLVKVVLVLALLRNKLWAYPWMIAVLLGFVAFQSYEFAVSPSFGLAVAHDLRPGRDFSDLAGVSPTATAPPATTSTFRASVGSGWAQHRHPILITTTRAAGSAAPSGRRRCDDAGSRSRWRRLPRLADGDVPLRARTRGRRRRQLRAPPVRPRARHPAAWSRSSRCATRVKALAASSPASGSTPSSATSPTPSSPTTRSADFAPRRGRALRRAALRAVLDDRPRRTRSTPRPTTWSAPSTCCTRSREIDPTSTWSSSAPWASTARPTSTSRRAGSRSPTRAAPTAALPEAARAPSTTCRRCTTATTSSSAAGSGGCGPPTSTRASSTASETEQTALDPRLATRFDYDAVFGTVLNRFVVQAVARPPADRLRRRAARPGLPRHPRHRRCLGSPPRTPPSRGEFRVFNQFTESFSVLELAERVSRRAARTSTIFPTRGSNSTSTTTGLPIPACWTSASSRICSPTLSSTTCCPQPPRTGS